MKPRKRPSQEPPIPTQDESRRANVLMEQMLSKFDAFGEVQSHIIERLDRIEPRFDKLEEKADVLESAVLTHSDAIRANTQATRASTEVIHAMQSDLKNINQRIEVVEAKVAS